MQWYIWNLRYCWVKTASDANESDPFLSVGILEIVDGAVVPSRSDPDERQRQEAVLTHDDEVRKEAAERLQVSHLSAGEAQQSERDGGGENI